jgi:uncharacterized phage protein (TIGR01671 family)
MREIKFRAWEKNLKEIISINSINFEHKMVNMDSAWRFFNEIELMQFTGLKDKNGKEIYEGDVIQFKDSICDGYRNYPVTRKNKVTFGNGMYWGGFEAPLYRVCDKSVVIGNIYENPELLEG